MVGRFPEQTLQDQYLIRFVAFHSCCALLLEHHQRLNIVRFLSHTAQAPQQNATLLLARQRQSQSEIVRLQLSQGFLSQHLSVRHTQFSMLAVCLSAR